MIETNTIGYLLYHSKIFPGNPQVRTWEGWHHHMALTLIAVWFLIEETHRGQQWTPALTLPQVRYGLSVLLLEVFCTPGIDSLLPNNGTMCL